MIKRLVLLVGLEAVIACGGSADGSSNQGLNGTGGSGGSAASGGGSSGASTGGGAVTGGSVGTAGTAGAGGAAGTTGASAGTGGNGGAATSGTGGSINCANVGCGPPPDCESGCAEPCGCCPCADGTVEGNRVCTGGCYALMDGGTTTCVYSGVTYAVGASYPAGDGCNTCTCLATGASTCTLRPCAAP